MSIPKDFYKDNSCLSYQSILLAYRGSISHGCYVPNSDPTSVDDKDVMGVCVPSQDYYFGIKSDFPTNGTKEIKKDEWDIVIYEARKFIHLLSVGNPNVLSLLWLSPNYYLQISDMGKLLIENRNLFVGRHVYKSFIGYAYSQLHRMTHINNSENTELSNSKGQRRYNLSHLGAKRKSLVDKFGFDCKNASHLIRLLRMGAEFLKDGELYVLREDAKQLLEIKRGEWTLDQVKAEADRGFKNAELAYLNSDLPKSPDLDAINKLSVEIIHTELESRN